MSRFRYSMRESGIPRYSGSGGYLRLGFELEPCGERTILRDWERRAPLIVQQALYFDERMRKMPCVYILSSGGPTLEGDYCEQNLSLSVGAEAHISTGAATKIAQMYGGVARFKQHIHLEENSYLEYLPQAIIPSRGSRISSDVEIIAASTSTLFYVEWFLSGRIYYGGERFLYDEIELLLSLRDEGLKELYNEHSLIQPRVGEIGCRGVLADYDIFANILVLLPKQSLDPFMERLKPKIRVDGELSLGALLLPDSRGVACRLLGQKSRDVKREIRALCSILRQCVKHRELPEEFVWR